MITKGTVFQPLFAKGGSEPTVIFKDGKIVYSKYVVFGTTYNMQDFTFTTTISNIVYTWHCEVLSKAGTDADGEYYYFGLINDIQGLAFIDNPSNVIAAMLGSALQSTVKCREVLYMIPFGSVDDYGVYYVGCRGNTTIKSFDCSLIPANSLSSLQEAFNTTGLYTLNAFGTLLQRQDVVSLNLQNAIYNNSRMTVVDIAGFTHWHKVSNARNFLSALPNVTSIAISEADAENPNFINPPACANCTNLTSFDFAKFKIKKWATLPNMSDCSNLTTITGLDGIMLQDGASASNLFRNNYLMTSNPHIDTWTGSDGVTKPTLTVANTNVLFSNCGSSVAAAERNWEFDIRGWHFSMGAFAYQDTANPFGFYINSCIGNGNGYGVRIAGITLIPYSTNTWVIISVSIANNVFVDSHIDYDSMVESQYDIYIGKNVLYQVFLNNTNVTRVTLGRAQVLDYGGEINIYALARVFQGATNLTSIDLRARHFNVYRYQWNELAQEYQTTLATFNIGQATAWADATQLGDLIGDLATVQSQQYAHNGIPLDIQFNAAQESVIKALPNWSTMESQIAANGWNLIWPVLLADTPQNINMSELDAI
jgi:hypothetical protein